MDIGNPTVFSIITLLFTYFLKGIYKRFNDFCKNSNSRIDFIQNAIFIISKNKTTLNSMTECFISINDGLKQIEHINSTNAIHSSTLDKLVYGVLLEYEKSLTVAISIASASRKNRRSYSNFVKTSDLVISQLEICLDIYKRTLQSKKLAIATCFNLHISNPQQEQLQERLRKLSENQYRRSKK